MADPFTLKIFVPSGDPEGVRIVDRMNWTGCGYVVPRDRWAEVKDRPELSRPGVYLLMGYETDDLGNDRRLAYIGQTENLRKRIGQHHVKQDFWDGAVLFLSNNDGLNSAHTRWLEWHLIKRANEVSRCRLLNGLTPAEPAMTESDKEDTRAFLREVLRILPVMGVEIFEKPRTASVAALTVAGLVPTAVEVRDTIVVPAQKEGFERAFLGANAWWAIRIAEKHRRNLKWIAAYQTLPIAAVTHVAEIATIEPYGDAGKFKVIFKGPAQALQLPIPFGTATPGSMQGLRYTTRTALQLAKSVKELV